MDSYSKFFGWNVNRIREEKKMRREELAEKAGIDPSTIGKIERGETNPCLSTMVHVSTALGVPLAELFAQPDDFYASAAQLKELPEITQKKIQVYMNKIHLLLDSDHNPEKMQEELDNIGYSEYQVISINVVGGGNADKRYGIRGIYYIGNRIVDEVCIDDISSIREKVEKLCAMLIEHQVFLAHFHDVVEDFLQGEWFQKAE